MFYTSGTTARPKGVVHGALADRPGRARGMEGQVALWGWTEDDVYVMSGPAYHASHLGWSLCSLYVGATTVVTEQFEARSWLGEVARHRGRGLHGAGPLHPDPRNPRGRAGRPRCVQPGAWWSTPPPRARWPSSTG